MTNSRDPIRSHRDLTVWQRAMQVRRKVYLLTAELPTEERWEIGRQMRRSALSIPCCIAEGHQRTFRHDYKQYLSMARGEAGELDTQLIAVSQDHPRFRPHVDEGLALLDEVFRMLFTMIRKV